MPQIIHNFRPVKKGGFPSKYPWEKWFHAIRERTNLGNGEGFKLVQGKDFDCKIEHMATRLRREATKHGFRVNIYLEKDGLVIFYAHPITEPTTRDGTPNVPLRNLRSSGSRKATHAPSEGDEAGRQHRKGAQSLLHLQGRQR